MHIPLVLSTLLLSHTHIDKDINRLKREQILLRRATYWCQFKLERTINRCATFSSSSSRCFQLMGWKPSACSIGETPKATHQQVRQHDNRLWLLGHSPSRLQEAGITEWLKKAKEKRNPSPFQNTSLGDGGAGFSLYFCYRIGCVAGAYRFFGVKCEIIHNHLCFNLLIYE